METLDQSNDNTDANLSSEENDIQHGESQN